MLIFQIIFIALLFLLIGFLFRSYRLTKSELILKNGELFELQKQLDESRKSNENLINTKTFSDSLTGSLNRFSFLRELKKISESTASYGVIYVGVNSLDYINRHEGFSAGDNKIIKVHSILNDFFKDENSSIYRINGGTFAIIIEEIDYDEFQSKASLLVAQNKMEKLFSAGKAWCLNGKNILEALSSAEDNMRSAKYYYYANNVMLNTNHNKTDIDVVANLCRQYTCIGILDVKTQLMHLYRNNGLNEDINTYMNGSLYQPTRLMYAKRFVVEEDQEKFAKDSDINKIMESLKTSNVYTLYYKSTQELHGGDDITYSQWNFSYSGDKSKIIFATQEISLEEYIKNKKSSVQ